jgi:hypothetical protein
VDRGFDALIAEAEAVDVTGWDFSWLHGRATEERPPWGYQKLMGERVGRASMSLDVQTGGGEVLAGVPQRAAKAMVATESWLASPCLFQTPFRGRLKKTPACHGGAGQHPAKTDQLGQETTCSGGNRQGPTLFADRRLGGDDAADHPVMRAAGGVQNLLEATRIGGGVRPEALLDFVVVQALGEHRDRGVDGGVVVVVEHRKAADGWLQLVELSHFVGDLLGSLAGHGCPFR